MTSTSIPSNFSSNFTALTSMPSQFRVQILKKDKEGKKESEKTHGPMKTCRILGH